MASSNRSPFRAGGEPSGAWVTIGAGATGLLAALVFCFVMFPRLEGAVGANLDPDDYGAIGRNLYQGHGLTADVTRGPTVYRGPGYPALIAAALGVSGGAYPYAVWIVQSLLHAVTCVLAARLAGLGFGTRAALIAGLGLAIWPPLFWYTPRMWNDGPLAAVATAVFLLAAKLVPPVRNAIPLKSGGDARLPREVARADSSRHSSLSEPAGLSRTVLLLVALGLLVGALCLTKGSFLPWIVVLPVLLWFYGGRALRRRLWLLPMLAILCVVPWTFRNHAVSGAWVPVHTGAAFNVVIGNEITRDFPTAPLGYGDLWNPNIGAVLAMTDSLTTRGAPREVEKEYIYRRRLREDFARDPWLLPAHALVAGASFWYLSETPEKTIVLGLLRLPVLLLGAMGIVRYLRSGDRRLVPALVLALLFWVSHLPFAPPARLSLPILPLIGVFAAGEIAARWPVRGFGRWRLPM